MEGTWRDYLPSDNRWVVHTKIMFNGRCQINISIIINVVNLMNLLNLLNDFVVGVRVGFGEQ